MASCWESFTAALSPLLAREEAADRQRRLTEDADALRRQHDEAVCKTAADEAATLDAEMREREADADRRVIVMTKEKNEEELRVMITELMVKDERLRVLEAIYDTVSSSKKPVRR